MSSGALRDLSGDAGANENWTQPDTSLSATSVLSLSQPLLERGKRSENEVWIHIYGDADIVLARKAARDLAARLNFVRTE